MSRFGRWSKFVPFGVLFAVLLAAGTVYQVYVTRADYLLERGRSAVKHGNWNQAHRYEELLERRGYRNHAHLLHGETWLGKARLTSESAFGAAQPLSAGLNAYQLALGELAQTRDEGPLTLEATVLGAECLVRLGERRFAAEVLDNVVQRNPDHKEAHRWLAAIYIDLNNPSQAITHLRAWGRLDPRNGRPFRWIGWFLSRDYGKLSEAIEAYREACRRDLEPHLRAEVVKELAEALADGPAAYQEALDTLNECPEVLDQPETLTLRAQCLWSLGQQAEAIQALDAALRADPRLPQALRLRAKIFLADGQPRAALALLETALQVDAHDHMSRQLLMQTYKQVGENARAEQARQLLEETRNYNDRLTKLHDDALSRPWNCKVRQQLADLCLKLNRKAEAQMWRQAALACTPNQAPEFAFEQPFLLPERN